MNEKPETKKFISIIIFAVVFSFVVQDGIRLVIQKFLEIPDEHIALANWGDTFFLHIVASLIATASGTFVIGTFLKNKAKLAGIIATLPTAIFWIVALVIGTTVVREQGYSFENIKKMLLLPCILVVLSPIVGYFSAKWGQQYFDEFQKPKSILNIKWYHWLWIFPLYLNKVVAVPLFTLILLWIVDANSSWVMIPLFELIFNFGNTVSRIIIFFIFMGSLASINHVYLLLSEEKTTVKINWKKGVMIFSHVLLFSILCLLLFAR